ncbi:glycosyltransferase family 9 protein [Micromonospora robiginosa]|uniref:Glycosyltransferase family 9 protein n=1 Tax=Micromonospora robiginosa TaxID=2749844 RepID=A0A7L6BED9_9ACTN|nr:glycosyltransferase family 9 protein [Micromonospora ferruginea]QLQ40322.2 glycosyltransferase family 9 protein [Micromonospora ferruginea]
MRESGWHLDLGTRGLGDVLLGLAMAQGLHEATRNQFPQPAYVGPRADLLARCALPLSITSASGHHSIGTVSSTPRTFAAVPEVPPTRLDIVDANVLQVHAALPMRYYLDVEQTLGVRLNAASDPCPRFRTIVPTHTPYHVVFVSTTSRPERKDYGIENFEAIARCLTAQRPDAPWRFSLITAPDRVAPPPVAQIEVLHGPTAVECLDLFATAELVVGNDTGLTHLAALTTRPDGTGPTVVGLYGRHAHTKWITGSTRHHAVATPFSQLMSIADACPVRDGYDDTIWSSASDLRAVPAELIARFAGECAGWWDS